jgi:hypothetical protein
MSLLKTMEPFYLSDTSERVLLAMSRAKNRRNQARVTLKELANLAGLPYSKIQYCVWELKESGAIYQYGVCRYKISPEILWHADEPGREKEIARYKSMIKKANDAERAKRLAEIPNFVKTKKIKKPALRLVYSRDTTTAPPA